MQITAELIELRSDDQSEFTPWLDRAGGRVLELGCGAGQNARAIAEHGGVESVVGVEIDEIQHRHNLAASVVPRLSFELGGAQAIPAADASFDMVFMFKSLHHVPEGAMDQALEEIHRVLRPRGIAYVSEPIFAGRLNEVLALFHDESRVRRQAFEALERSVDRGLFELEEERFFLRRSVFRDFEAFEREVIDATHTEHRLSAETLAQVRRRFERHLAVTQGEFFAPQRVDVLRAVDCQQ